MLNGPVYPCAVSAPDEVRTLPLNPAQADGAKLSLTATDGSGNVSVPASVTVDNRAPDAPVVDPTNGTNLTGTAETGSTVTVKDPAGTVIGSGTADKDGNYSIPLNPAQPVSTEITVTDGVSNTSAPTTVSVPARLLGIDVKVPELRATAAPRFRLVVPRLVVRDGPSIIATRLSAGRPGMPGVAPVAESPLSVPKPRWLS